ncbi:MAG TPA: tyrosinase family protein [Chloroflexota bacterium]|jgi:tyrosinase
MPNGTHTRQDVWKLNQWDPTILWFAKAIADMQTRPFTDPTSWRYQAAIHDYTPADDPNPKVAMPSAATQKTFWKQCQHGSWFFLPWHRMYLFYFEQIVAATVTKLGGPSGWSLPYWNYSDPGNPSARKLPTAFRAPKLPDGTSNPLLIAARAPGVNQGADVSGAADVELQTSLSKQSFVAQPHGGDPGFGGPQTGFSHNGASVGELERVPHGLIHMDVGGQDGWMSAFDTAALDPIFWLHHANLDRLWTVWMGRAGGHANPNANNWRNQSFQFHDATGNVVSLSPAQVVDTTVAPLRYQYQDVSDPLGPAVAAPLVGLQVEQQPPPEMVGATTAPHALAEQPTTAHLSVAAPTGPGLVAAPSGAAQRIYLNIENITGTGKSTGYEVYLNLPPDADPQQHRDKLVGILPMFGVAEASRSDAQHAGSGLHYALDATDVIRRLQANNAWNPTDLRITFVPRRRGDVAPPGLSAARPGGAIQVGRISLYYA